MSAAPEVASPEVGAPEVVAYDFRRPSRISPNRQRTLDASHDQLAQGLQRWLAARLRSPLEVHHETIGQLAYGEFIDSIEDPGATFLYTIKDMRGLEMAVHVDAAIAYFLVERLVGGNDVTPPLDRALTELEQVVMRIATDRVAKEVSLVWKDQMELNLEFSRFESARALVEMMGRDEDILVTALRVTLGETTGLVRFALPFEVVESLFGSPKGPRIHTPERSPAERNQEKAKAASVLRQANVVVAARIPGSRVTLERLSGLKPGDFLTTETSMEDPVEVHVSGRLRFRGRQGKLGPHLGVRITDPVATD